MEDCWAVEQLEVSQSESVPDILQTIAQLDPHTKLNQSFHLPGSAIHPNQTLDQLGSNPNQTLDQLDLQPKPNVIVNELSGVIFTTERQLIDLDEDQFNYISINQNKMDASV